MSGWGRDIYTCVCGIGAFPCLASYLCACTFVHTDPHTRVTYIPVYSRVRACRRVPAAATAAAAVRVSILFPYTILTALDVIIDARA